MGGSHFSRSVVATLPFSRSSLAWTPAYCPVEGKTVNTYVQNTRSAVCDPFIIAILPPSCGTVLICGMLVKRMYQVASDPIPDALPPVTKYTIIPSLHPPSIIKPDVNHDQIAALFCRPFGPSRLQPGENVRAMASLRPFVHRAGHCQPENRWNSCKLGSR